MTHHAYVMKPPQNAQSAGFREVPDWRAHGGAGRVVCQERAWKAPPRPAHSPYAALPYGCTFISFTTPIYNKPVNVNEPFS